MGNGAQGDTNPAAPAAGPASSHAERHPVPPAAAAPPPEAGAPTLTADRLWCGT